MTQFTIIGEEPTKKKTQFTKYYNDNSGQFQTDPTWTPDKYKRVELVKRNEGGYDVMLAYDTNRNLGTLYLGHWNDGCV